MPQITFGIQHAVDRFLQGSTFNSIPQQSTTISVLKEYKNSVTVAIENLLLSYPPTEVYPPIDQYINDCPPICPPIYPLIDQHINDCPPICLPINYWIEENVKKNGHKYPYLRWREHDETGKVKKRSLNIPIKHKETVLKVWREEKSFNEVFEFINNLKHRKNKSD